MTMAPFDLRRAASGHAALNLIWFHHAGGTGDSYKAFAQWVPPDWNVVFVEYPGRGQQAHLPFEQDLRTLAGRVLQSLAPHLNMPYALFGHSMGSLVAYEVACAAQDHGQRPPVWLGVSAHRAPSTPPDRRYRLHRLSDGALRQAIAELQGGGAAPAPDGPQLMRMRADLGACESHFLREPRVLPCPMSGYLGDIDPMVRPADMHGWQALSSHSWRLSLFPGHHFYFGIQQRRGFMRQLVGDVQAALATAPP